MIFDRVIKNIKRLLIFLVHSVQLLYQWMYYRAHTTVDQVMYCGAHTTLVPSDVLQGTYNCCTKRCTSGNIYLLYQVMYCSDVRHTQRLYKVMN